MKELYRKTLEVYEFYDGGETITIQEFQAINEKVKELRMDKQAVKQLNKKMEDKK